MGVQHCGSCHCLHVKSCRIPQQLPFETRQCSKPIAFHLSNVTNQQEDKHNRCSGEDYVRRRYCVRCRASGRIARRTGGVE